MGNGSYGNSTGISGCRGFGYGYSFGVSGNFGENKPNLATNSGYVELSQLIGTRSSGADTGGSHSYGTAQSAFKYAGSLRIGFVTHFNREVEEPMIADNLVSYTAVDKLFEVHGVDVESEPLENGDTEYHFYTPIVKKKKMK